MTDVLDQIDDTLDNWHSSADSMRWRPTPSILDAQQVIVHFQANLEAFQASWRHICEHVAALYTAMKPVIDVLEQPRPSHLNAAYRQRAKNRVKRRRR